jgi:hypothetical protein
MERSVSFDIAFTSVGIEKESPPSTLSELFCDEEKDAARRGTEDSFARGRKPEARGSHPATTHAGLKRADFV